MKTIELRVVVASVLVMAATVVVAGPKGPTIVDVAVAVNSEGPYAGEFDILIAAVGAADSAVAATLTGNGQHTVFAPVDSAFEAIGVTTNNVAELDQVFLTEVLLYHVAKGRRDSEQVIDSSQIRTLLRDFVQQDGGILTDNLGGESEIIVLDVPAANGIIHAIDAVLLPYAP